MAKILENWRRLAVGIATTLACVLAASSASAETLLMPPRDYLMGASEVVWGITTLPNTTSTYTIDFGDGVLTAPAAVSDRSYIAINHTYAISGAFTITLTVHPSVGPDEVATVAVNVYNGALLSAFDLRNLNVNRTIQNALRFLWTVQAGRAQFDTTTTTNWGAYAQPFTALVVDAFENHGYHLPSDNSAPVGIYPKYIVRRGMNYVLGNLTALTIGVTPAGNDPCVSVPAPLCGALQSATTGDPGYENALAILPIAGSNALNRTVTEVAAGVGGGLVNGHTLGEILQRMVNATTWGQGDTGTGRGGWWYSFNSGQPNDGSTAGWDMLALFDAIAAGANVPVWVKNEWSAPNQGLRAAINTDGSFDYQSDNNPASDNSVNLAKAGVGLQGMFYAGFASNDVAVTNAKTYISDRWNSNSSTSNLGQSFVCGNAQYNKGCAYGMFNAFKGLKLYGVATLPGVNRAAGPGAIPANDWYADLVDWLVTNQTNPLTTAGGNWANLNFSSQLGTDNGGSVALGLLILSPTALIPPDPTLFSTVGLKQGTPLSTNPDTNTVNTDHTVVATAQSAGGAVIPGVTISFQVTGRNNGATGSGVSDANGQVSFTYHDNGPSGSGGDDNITAFIGNVGSNLSSNTLLKHWIVPVVTGQCDVNGSGVVDQTDLNLIRAAFGQTPGVNDPRDGNGDGKIDIADLRYCQLHQGPVPH
jgi:hypothetical protein